jgi:hypothetical protein
MTKPMMARSVIGEDHLAPGESLTPIRLCCGFRSHAGRVPQRAGQWVERNRFLALGRGTIKLPVQQRQVAVRVTRFQRLFLLAACFLMVPAPVTFSNFAVTFVWAARVLPSGENASPTFPAPRGKPDTRCASGAKSDRGPWASPGEWCGGAPWVKIKSQSRTERSATASAIHRNSSRVRPLSSSID